MYEQIAEQIHQLIRSSFKPGDRLPPERELATQLSVSRPSVREAMIALETAGYIEVLTGSGTYVRPLPDSARLRFPWAKRQDPGPGVREQFQARQIVEPELAALACSAISDRDIDVLEQSIARAHEQFRTEGRRADDEDYFFHVSLAELSRNSVLSGLIRNLWDQRNHDEMWRTLRDRVCRPDHHAQIMAQRQAVVDALRRRDVKGARAAMVRYMKNGEKVFFG